MAQQSKKETTYSFEEYKKRFPPPPPSEEDEPIEDPAELGVKLAEKSLAKLREQARRSS